MSRCTTTGTAWILPLCIYKDVGYREDNIVGTQMTILHFSGDWPLCVSHDIGIGEHIALSILNFLSWSRLKLSCQTWIFSVDSLPRDGSCHAFLSPVATIQLVFTGSIAFENHSPERSWRPWSWTDNGSCPWGIYFLSFEWFSRRPKRTEGGCDIHLPYCSRKVCWSCRLWSLGIVLPDTICVFHWHKMPAKLFFLSVLVFQDPYSSYGLESVDECWLEQTAFWARYYILSLNVVPRPDCFLVSLLNILSVNRLCLGVGKMVTITIHKDQI